MMKVDQGMQAKILFQAYLLGSVRLGGWGEPGWHMVKCVSHCV